jgi:hypothetical protein
VAKKIPHSSPQPEIKRLLPIRHFAQLLNPDIDALLNVLFRLQDTCHRVDVRDNPAALRVLLATFRREVVREAG